MATPVDIARALRHGLAEYGIELDRCALIGGRLVVSFPREWPAPHRRAALDTALVIASGVQPGGAWVERGYLIVQYSERATPPRALRQRVGD